LKRKNAITINSQQAGQNLLEFVSQRFTYRSREEWRQEILAQRLLLNDVAARVGNTLVAGDRLTYLMPVREEPSVDKDYTVLYEDGDLLVINKPAPLPCHPGGRFFSHTLWALLKENHSLEKPRFVNRLDRETSGIVLVAKNKRAARRCQEQFIEGRVEKVYLAIVEGAFPETPEKQEVVGWLGIDPNSVIRKKMRLFLRQEDAPPKAVQASTSFRQLSSNGSLSLIEVRPQTGRCHQIRATLLHLGFPLVGDKLYGFDEQLFLRFMADSLTAADHATLRISRQALHAARLGIVHPVTGKNLHFCAPLPWEMRHIKAL
jgi:23S rRNA pseudouridine955/2504/2580 synthase/23S rRNA pseudouridine1911/1915/1917 synthase